MALAATSALALVIAGISPVQTAGAVTGDQSHSTGTFLSGSLLGTLSPTQLLQLGSAAADNAGGQPTVTQRNNLNATVLQSLGVNIGGGIQVPLALPSVGAVSSYATAADGATSEGASGLVDNQGAIGVGAVPGGAPGPLTIDLSQVVGTTLASELANLKLELGAISASASSTGGATPQGSYEIVGSRLLITSNTLAGTSATITGLVTNLQAAVTALNGPGGTLTAGLRSTVNGLPVIGGAVTVANANVTVTANLQAAVAPLLGVLGAGGPVTIDLSTGQIAVDLQQLNGSLNGLAPNTDILTSAELNTIATDVTALIAQLSTNVQSALTTALNNATVALDVQLASTVPVLGTVPLARIQLAGTVAQVLAGTGGTVTITAAGLPITGITPALVYGALQPVLQGVVNPTTGSLGVLATGLQNTVITPTTTVLKPALAAISTLITLTANVQNPSPAVTSQLFTETALRLQLLPQAAGPGAPPVATLLELDVAGATVGPNALNQPSSITSLTPTSGPTAGGTPVTITGSGFLGATGVTFGGTAGTAFTVVNDTTITVTTPPHAAATTPVVVQDPGGNSAPGSFTFVPPPAVSGLNPAAGPTAGGTVVTLTGSNLTGATGVTFDGLPGTAFTVNSPTSITVTSPAHPVGTIGVVVNGPFGASAPAVYNYVTSPAITGLTPTSGPIAGGTPVTITGTGFTGATGVAFGGTNGTAFTVVSDTSITVTSPAHAVGPVDVVVASPGGNSAPQTFTYLAAPTITSIAPTTGPSSGGTTVTITGSGFTGTTGVTFGGAPATGVVVNSPTSLTVTSPAHAAGTVGVVVTTSSGSSAPGDFTFVDTPAISGLTPVSGPSAGGTPVTITGTGFTNATGVTFGGAPGTAFQVVNPTTITVTTPAHAAGPVAVVVTDPTQNSAPGTFTFVAPAVPNVTGLVPNNGPTAGGTSVVITGTDFTGATAVAFGTLPATSFTVDSATQITATSPAAPAGTVGVVVTTPNGSSIGVPYTYVPPTAPAITGITPASGPVTGNTAVTITGTNFTGATGVTFRGVPGTGFVVTSPTTISVNTPANTVGAADVVVQSPAGASVPDTFTYLAVPAPTISGLSPTSGPTAGGTTVTITGTGFTGTTAVNFGGTPATSFTVNSPTSITAVSPLHAAGAVDVTVQNPNGVSAGATFTFVAPPAETGLTPTSGPTSGGTSVVITGTALGTVTSVTFGGTPATSFVIDSATQITALAPAHPAGTVGVIASGPNGATLPDDFTFVAPPAITSLNPNSGPVAGGTVVSITGTGFTGATGVTFAGAPGTAFTVNSPTSITVTSPAGIVGPANVVVTGPLQPSAPSTFTYFAPAVITSVAPTSGQAVGGTAVTITGTGLTGSTGVTFGGIPATLLTVTPTTITVLTPAHAVGPVDVVVQNPNGDSAPGAFTYIAPPTVAGLSPVSGPIAGGTSVTITGTGFTGTTGVTFGGVQGTAVTVVSPTTITVTTPAHAAGPVDVVVQHPSGDSLPATYTYVTAAAITTVAPSSGPVSGGTSVTITGTGFTGATGVTFGGVPATGLTVVSPTTITVTSPAGTLGTQPVVVQSPNGNSGAGTFTYVPDPVVIGSLSPSSGTVAGGTVVTITGGDFTGATGVTFGGVPATTFVVNGPTSITVTSPAGQVGASEVVVLDPAGDSAGVPFTYVPLVGDSTVNAPTAAASAALPFTGWNAEPWLIAGLVLLAIGMLLTLLGATRRRIRGF